MDQQTAHQEINAILQEVDRLIAKAESIADAHGITFRYDGPTYGMGGRYSEVEGWQASSMEGC